MPKRKKIVAKSKNLRRSKFSFNHLILVALAFGLIGGLATWAALAAPGGKPGGGGGGGGSKGIITGPIMVTDQNSDGLPNHGDKISFKVATTATDQPYINLNCYQNGSYVYGAWVGYFNGAWFDKDFTLSSDLWQNGAADCTAKLVAWTKSGKQQILTTRDFHVNP